MENTKLYFNLERDFNTNIELIANNHIDLEKYLNSVFDISVKSLNVNDDQCIVRLPNDNQNYYADIRWITHI
jgi:hypothetical protein